MKRLALALLASLTFASVATGCAAMGTKRSGGAQIQRTAQPSSPLDTGSPDARPELGQR
jgi:hypothetical protein